MKFPSRRRCVALGFAILTLASVSAQAAVLVVTNTLDSGIGSLRDTIDIAHNGDTIQFSPALNGQTITLTTVQILIDKSITINGPGADKMTVRRSTADGTATFRLFEITKSVTLTGLTLANGKSADVGGTYYPAGGAIYFYGSELAITDCVISGNSAEYGGGVYVASGYTTKLTLTNSVVSGNSAEYGGGIYVHYVVGSYIAQPGRLVMINSTISGNSATSLGGGLYNRGISTITGSTISGNVASMDAAGGGGGIYSENGLTVTNSTISGNSASLGGGIKNVAAHYFFLPGSLGITSSTVSGNTASEGGGIYSASPNPSSKNSIIARNTSANGPDVKGTLASRGFNLIGDNSGLIISTSQPSDQIGTSASPIDPLLGPLQDNGGPTFTHALLLGSPAIDKGESSAATSDQRGFGRRKDIPALANAADGDGADIGAFETGFAKLANISTRLRVQTGDNAMIGGFIITGTGQKTVLVRGIGPSLPLAGALADPFIEVYGPSGEFLATNDNWRDATTRTEIANSGLAPANDLEPALWGVINPGAYTVVVRGNNNTTGIGLFEVYDLDQAVESNLGNISTRGFVGTGDDVMIGGTIITGSVPARVVFRAIGPSLTNFGVSNALGDPVLELHDGNGEILAVTRPLFEPLEAPVSYRKRFREAGPGRPQFVERRSQRRSDRRSRRWA
jgi:hypothetical protein